MTAANLPGQLELPVVIDHKRPMRIVSGKPRDVQMAELLVSYEQRPSSETWSRIQALATEIMNNQQDRRTP